MADKRPGLADAIRAAVPPVTRRAVCWWEKLDAETLASLVSRVAQGEPASITLCGERGWQRFDAAPRSLWQQLVDRFKTVEPHTVLSAF